MAIDMMMQAQGLVMTTATLGGPPPVGGGSNTTSLVPMEGSGTLEGGAPAAGQAPAPGLFGMDVVLLMLVVFGGIILFSTFGQRKQKKKREAMLNSIDKNDSVQTIGGIIGSVVEVKDDTVVLQVDTSSKTRMTFSRAAVQTVLNKEGTDSGN